ncbi:hypothetical protein BAY61_10090 [Prauserella marina]|nr:hypothetical protein BAY61_10090 [Prauserella marina]
MAAIVDGLVVVVLLGMLYLAFAALGFLIDPTGFAFPVPGREALVLAWFVLAVLYLSVCWAGTARTVGDQLLGLRVLGARGFRLRWGQACVRALACVLFPWGLLWILAGRHRRSLQDLLLRTVVIYDWGPRLPRTSPATREAKDDGERKARPDGEGNEDEEEGEDS